MEERTYSIGEVSEMLQINISTLRYYDKHGLLPLIKRTEGNIRIFTDQDIEWIKMIECLKNTGMQLKDIHTFFQWCIEGDSTIENRYQMFLDLRAETEKKIATLKNSLDLINYKCNYYAKAMEAGTTDIPELNKKCPNSIEAKKESKLFCDAVTNQEKKKQ